MMGYATDKFQSTRPRGRTRQHNVIYCDTVQVSIHASSREDATPRVSMSGICPSFNPRVLAGGRDMLSACFRMYSASFNPRVLAGGRDTSDRHGVYHKMFQSTRPRGRTRLRATVSVSNCLVSIHASSREDATQLCRWFRFFQRFQSTRPRGRTRHADSTSFAMPSQFQSTRPRGRTRLRNRELQTGGKRFNPRVLAGGRDVSLMRLTLTSWFQSTRPRGRTRPGGRAVGGYPPGFNPRVLAGGRDASVPL